MSPEPLVSFALLLIALLAVPGPTNALLARAGLTLGIRRALPLVGAELVGYSVGLWGIGVVMDRHGLNTGAWRIGLPLAAAVLSTWLAIRMWRSITQPDQPPVTMFMTFLVTLFNPKTPLLAWLLLGTPGLERLHVAIAIPTMLAVGVGWIWVGSMIGQVPGTRWYARLTEITAAAFAIFAALMLLRLMQAVAA